MTTVIEVDTSTLIPYSPPIGVREVLLVNLDGLSRTPVRSTVRVGRTGTPPTRCHP